MNRWFFIQDNAQEGQDESKRLEYYKAHKGQFVTITKKDGVVAAGILIDITPDNHLFIKGKYKSAICHYLEVKDFSAREDRFANSTRGDLRA